MPPPPTTDAGEAIAAVFDLIVAKDMRASYRRFMALAWLLDPDRYFEGRTETQVASYLGFTRAGFSLIVRELSEKTGIRNRHMKREGAVGVYRQRQERIWESRASNYAEERDSQLFLNGIKA